MTNVRLSSTSRERYILSDLEDVKLVTQIRTAKTRVRCYGLSDMHADSEKGLRWVQSNCNREDKHRDNTLSIFVIPGDIGSNIVNIQKVLQHLVSQYDVVCYVPGNHEAWTVGSVVHANAKGEFLPAEDSIKKLSEINDLARRLGVIIGPLSVEYDGRTVFIFPMQAWYHTSFDTEPELQNPLYLKSEERLPFDKKWSDFRLCRWPSTLISGDVYGDLSSREDIILSKTFALLNEHFLFPAVEEKQEAGSPLIRDYYRAHPDLDADRRTVISFSHFVPRKELTPEKRYLIEPQLSKVIGSDILEAQLRRLHPDLHLFGHTHIPIDMELDDIRYIQWPLGYAREAEQQCAAIFQSGPLCVFDSIYGDGSHGIPEAIASQNTYWSNYYRSNKRDPTNVLELSPWLIKRLEMFAL